MMLKSVKLQLLYNVDVDVNANENENENENEISYLQSYP